VSGPAQAAARGYRQLAAEAGYPNGFDAGEHYVTLLGSLWSERHGEQVEVPAFNPALVMGSSAALVDSLYSNFREAVLGWPLLPSPLRARQRHCPE
jgi:hypothetical protein